MQITSFRRGFSVFFFIFFLSLISRAPLASALECNGSTELCERPYNEVTYVVTHNAQSNQKNLLFSLIPGSNISNQSRSMLKQLRQGIRGMKLPVYEYADQTYVCHGMNASVKIRVKQALCEKLWFLNSTCGGIVDNINPCQFDPATKTLGYAFKKVAKFLNENPNEVVTLFLEDHAGDFPKIMAEFDSSGLTRYLHGQNQLLPWPKLGEMIQANKRLVVFINHERDRQGRHINGFPLLNNQKFFAWGTQFTFRSIDSLTNDHPSDVRKNQFALARWDDFPRNKVWIMQHFITPTLGGDRSSAEIVNRAEFIDSRIKKYTETEHGLPTYLWVDYYEAPASSPGIFDIVRRINRLQ
jgi:hypothetical protein